MRNTDERVQAALLGAKRIRQKRQLRAITAGSVALSLCLIVVLSCTLPTLVGGTVDAGATSGLSASLFASAQALSYIIIGMLSFLLGISVTILCVLLRKKQQEDHHEP